MRVVRVIGACWRRKAHDEGNGDGCASHRTMPGLRRRISSRCCGQRLGNRSRDNARPCFGNRFNDTHKKAKLVAKFFADFVACPRLRSGGDVVVVCGVVCVACGKQRRFTTSKRQRPVNTRSDCFAHCFSVSHAECDPRNNAHRTVAGRATNHLLESAGRIDRHRQPHARATATGQRSVDDTTHRTITNAGWTQTQRQSVDGWF